MRGSLFNKAKDHSNSMVMVTNKPKPSSSSSTTTSSSSSRASSSSHVRNHHLRKGNAAAVVVPVAINMKMKPWADQPWPLIDIPSRTHNVSHPALYIANELSHIHNAMIRGLNAIYIQTSHVQEPQDIADLLFLAKSWARWVSDHHVFKERVLFPEFEKILAISAGGLTLRRDEEEIEARLHRIVTCTTATTTTTTTMRMGMKDLQGLLSDLANTLVPHLNLQIGIMASMREMCFGITGKKKMDMPISRISTSPSPSSTSSTSSSTYATTYPSSQVSARQAEARSAALMQTYLTLETRFSSTLDHFVVFPMIVRLRDVTFPTTITTTSSSSSSSSPASSISSRSSSSSSSLAGTGIGVGGGGGGENWPRLSIPAIHAIADRLSPKYSGSWRPRELPFSA
ncbi:hypothetical protein GGS20DRAFT_522869 [Poronia punctata]|nr:hypothetical protein GGS20DRAFT_522869 [Poronia punctata]